jgi:hypothetical protein
MQCVECVREASLKWRARVEDETRLGIRPRKKAHRPEIKIYSTPPFIYRGVDERNFPDTRAEAIYRGLGFYCTRKPCINGHVTVRLISGACIGCAAESAKRQYLKRRAAASARPADDPWGGL